jgi:hypothetical protein
MEERMKLHELATVLRSKSAGPFMNTMDIFFDRDELYKRVRDSGVLTKELIAELYKIRPEDVRGIYFVDQVRGIKITVPKPSNVASGDPQCRDLYGASFYIPLLDINIP